MTFRPYSPEDFEQLYALEERCFEPPFRFSRRMMKAFVQAPHSATWIAEENGQIAGFAIVDRGTRRGELSAYIQTIEVAPDARRSGVGRELIHRVEASARDAGAALIWLHVDAENASAIRLYEEQGYSCQGRKDGFYPQGRDGLIYAKRLDSSAIADSSVGADLSNRVARAN